MELITTCPERLCDSSNSWDALVYIYKVQGRVLLHFFNIDECFCTEETTCLRALFLLNQKTNVGNWKYSH